jgi:DNA repair ATPase RecN
MKKIANRVARRFKQAYLSMKIPVNYAFIVNCKKMLSEQGIEVEDEDLQEILSRYLDLVIYGLCNGTAPSKEDLINIAQDFVTEYNDLDEDEDEDEDLEFYEQEDRF